MTQPTNQPPQRSLDDHLSYLRTELYRAWATPHKHNATIAMHFAQYPHLYEEGAPCREYVETGAFGLALGNSLDAVARRPSAWAWFVAAMTPEAWAVLRTQYARIGLVGDIVGDSYAAALKYAWHDQGPSWKARWDLSATAIFTLRRRTGARWKDSHMSITTCMFGRGTGFDHPELGAWVPASLHLFGWQTWSCVRRPAPSLYGHTEDEWLEGGGWHWLYEVLEAGVHRDEVTP